MIEIIHADVMHLAPKELPDFDVFMADPPYSKHVHKNATSQSKRRGTRKRDLGFDHLSPKFRTWLGQASKQSKRWALIYSDVEHSYLMRHAYQIAKMQHVRTVPWIRWSMPNLTGTMPPQGFEHLLVAHQPPPGNKKHWNGPGNLTVCGAFDPDPLVLEHKALRGEDKHKSEKPLDQALDLVAWFSDPGETIFDPCCGAGTLGLACSLLGRNYIGFEMIQKWADIANERVQFENPTKRDVDRIKIWSENTLERENKRLLEHDREIAEELSKWS